MIIGQYLCRTARMRETNSLFCWHPNRSRMHWKASHDIKGTISSPWILKGGTLFLSSWREGGKLDALLGAMRVRLFQSLSRCLSENHDPSYMALSSAPLCDSSLIRGSSITAAMLLIRGGCGSLRGGLSPISLTTSVQLLPDQMPDLDQGTFAVLMSPG